MDQLLFRTPTVRNIYIYTVDCLMMRLHVSMDTRIDVKHHFRVHEVYIRMVFNVSHQETVGVDHQVEQYSANLIERFDS